MPDTVVYAVKRYYIFSAHYWLQFNRFQLGEEEQKLGQTSLIASAVIYMLFPHHVPYYYTVLLVYLMSFIKILPLFHYLLCQSKEQTTVSLIIAC